MTYLLAALDDPDAAARALSEVTDADIEVVAVGPLACIGIAWSGPPPEPDAPALRRHDRMVRCLMDECTVVPFRFATMAASRSEVESWLEKRSGQLPALLAGLRGRAEMAVRAAVSGGPQEPAGSGGRAYLEMLRRERTADPELAGLHRALEAVSAASVLSVGNRHRITGSYLVDERRIPSFRETAERAASRSPSITTVSVTGPWAPYSFVAEPAGKPAGGRPHA